MLRTLMVVAFAAMISMGAAEGCAQAGDGVANMSSEQLQARIAKELPTGSSWDQVVEFLDKQKIEHSGHSSGTSQDRIYAVIRGVKGSTLTTTKSLQVIFDFKEKRLTGFSVSEQLTGP